jgi:hypothetical protein
MVSLLPSSLETSSSGHNLCLKNLDGSEVLAYTLPLPQWFMHCPPYPHQDPELIRILIPQHCYSRDELRMHVAEWHRDTRLDLIGRAPSESPCTSLCVLFRSSAIARGQNTSLRR